MNVKDFKALTIGFHVIGGIIAGFIIGLLIDKLFIKLFNTNISPWGLIVFIILGTIAGFKNIYEDMKKIL